MLLRSRFEVDGPARPLSGTRSDEREVRPGPGHQFNDPLRVAAFNTLEHWAKDVSEDIAAEIQTRLDMEAMNCPNIYATSSRATGTVRAS